MAPETMRGGEPYLSPDDEAVGRWRDRLEAVTGRFRIGVAWQGHPRHADDARRSFRLDHLAPLASAPGVALMSLQQGPGCEQLAGPEFPVVDLGFEYQVGDWLDTAAIISQLDLVISADTSVAHCAGGMGRPTWIALSHCAEWRWLLDRDDSPWYSSARLFRQVTASGRLRSFEIHPFTQERPRQLPGDLTAGPRALLLLGRRMPNLLS